MKIKAEYIWIDGLTPTAKLRSKTKIIEQDPTIFKTSKKSLDTIPTPCFFNYLLTLAS